MEPERNDFRRSVERNRVQEELRHTLGIVYPSDRPAGISVELVSCALCGTMLQRAVGSSVIFCHHCIAKMR